MKTLLIALCVLMLMAESDSLSALIIWESAWMLLLSAVLNYEDNRK